MIIPKLLKPKRGVALIHFGRAGSTLLSTMIIQNRFFFNEGELFEKVRVGAVKIPKKISNNPGLLFQHRTYKFFYKKYLVSIKPIPEEHLRQELLNMNYVELINNLKIAGISKYIIIKRKNYLKQILSGLLAIEWKKYHYKLNDKPEIRKIIVPCEDIRFGTFKGSLLTLFTKYDQYYEEIEKFTPNPLILNYEDDIEQDPMIAYEKAKKYLNLKIRKPNIILRKSNVFSNKEIIENYDEVKQTLENTPYNWML